MALQHFYSRVPAKVSMFNRADSFDTFARSENLDRLFIEKELGLYEDIKLTNKEGTKLRLEGLAPLYFQYKAKSGELIQSKVNFISKDYTGERSSYFIHSLVMDEHEQEEVFGSPDYKCFDGELFETDIDKYDITSPFASPNSDVPPLSYNALETGSIEWLSKYNENTMKRFIYVVLAAVCGKIKSVYFSLGAEPDAISEESLSFINAILQLLPYHVRPNVSFVTRLADSSRFSGIKLKSVTDECGVVQASRGAMISLRTGISSGFTDADVSNNYMLVEFIYSLITKDVLRREFLLFANKAVKAVPTLGALNLKSLSDLVFMFKVSCGAYEEMKVLPNDDRIYDFVCVYEKNKLAMSDEYRMNAMKCLKRYPLSYKEIPKKIFTKIAKLYPKEPACVKLVVMDVALELIHTDVMRERLFDFIHDNYADEPDTVREKIVHDLCRVYYGGFLMDDILSFFTENFHYENDACKEEIMDKLLLTIRTKAVQEKLIEFIKINYDNFSDDIKWKIYEALLDNISDGDEVAAALLGIINEHLEQEDDKLKNYVNKRLIDQIETEQKKKSQPLISLLASQGGYAGITLTKHVFGTWFRTKIFEHFVTGLCKGGIDKRVENIISVWTLIPDMSEDKIKKFYKFVNLHFAEDVQDNIYDILKAEKKLFEKLREINENANIFAGRISSEIFPGIAQKALPTFFGQKEIKGGAEFIERYANLKPEIKASSEYMVVTMYEKLKAAEEAENYDDAAIALGYFAQERELRNPAADYLAADTNPESFIASVTSSILKKGLAEYATIYNKTNKAEIDENGSQNQELMQERLDLIKKMFSFGYSVNKVEISPAVKQVFAPEKSGLNSAVSNFINEYGKTAKDALLEYISSFEETEYSKSAKNFVSVQKVQKEGLFSKLFSKK